MKQYLLPVLLWTVSGHWCSGYNKGDVNDLFDHGLNGINLRPDSVVSIGHKILLISKDMGHDHGILQGRVIKGIGHLFSNQLDSSSNQLLLALQLAEKLNAENTFEFGLAKNFLGSVFTRFNNLQKAKQCFQDALTIFERVNNKSYRCLANTNLGTIHGMQGNYPEALDYFLSAHKIANDPEVPIRRQAEAMSNISTVLSLMGKKEKALQYAFKTLAIDREQGLTRGVFISYNLIADIYGEHKEYDSALFYYQQNIDQIPVGNPRFTPIKERAISGMSKIYFCQNRLGEAISTLKKTWKERDHNQEEVLYNLIASNYLNLELYDSALHYAHKFYSIAKKNQNKNGLKDASCSLQAVYLAQKTFDSAYHYNNLYHQYNDSIYNESNEKKFNNSVIELVTLEKQQEIDRLRHERVIDKLHGRITLGGLAISILGVLAIFGFYRNRQRLKQRSLQRKLELNQKQLTNHTLSMVHKNNGFAQIEEEVITMRKKGEANFQKLLNIIDLNRSAEKDWDNFNNYFSAAHPNFEKKLTEKFPKLSISDKRLASLVKMRLTNNEMASILNIATKSVRMNKYRLKRKLGLSEETDLLDFISKM